MLGSECPHLEASTLVFSLMVKVRACSGDWVTPNGPGGLSGVFGMGLEMILRNYPVKTTDWSWNHRARRRI